MSTYGIIFCAWESQDLLAQSLTPWIDAREAHLGGHTFLICAVSVPFLGFAQPAQVDDTMALLSNHLIKGEIDHHIMSISPLSEMAARGLALKWLVKEGCDLTWMVDSDEIYATHDIEGAAHFVAANPYVAWFRMSLRNAVFTRDQYLVEPFTPPRIHRTSHRGWFTRRFCDDNNVAYSREASYPGIETVVRDDTFPSMVVPPGAAHPRHYSWLSTPRSRAKIRYQLDGRGWPSCSYRWDETTNQLLFNEAYYSARGLPLPEVARDPS